MRALKSLIGALALLASTLGPAAHASPEFNKGLAVGEVVALTPTCSPQPCIVGTSTLTAPAGMSGPYQWYNGASAVGGATSNTYTPSSAGTYTVSGTVRGVSIVSGTITAYTSTAFRNDRNASFGTASALTSAGTTVSGGDTGATADTSVFTLSFWVRAHAYHGDTSSTYSALNADFLTAVGTSTYSSEGAPGINFSFDNASGNDGSLRINIGDASATDATANQNNCNSLFGTGGGGLIQDQWQHYLISFDGRGTSSSTKNLAVYQNGVSRGAGCPYKHGNVLTSAAMVVPFASSPTPGWNLDKPLKGDGVGIYDFNYVMEDFSTSIVCVDTNPITVNGTQYACPGGANTIPAALVAKFYNAGFVDPGPNCATLGRTPQICLYGGGTDFTTNHGTLTGLTLTGPAYRAPYDQLGIPAHHAVNVWGYNSTAASVSPQTTSLGAHTITQGNLLILIMGGADSSYTTGNHNLTCPDGTWTQQYVGWDGAQFPGDPTDIEVCTKFAGASETGAYSLVFSPNFGRGAHWTLLEYANVASVEAVAGTITGGVSTTTGGNTCSPTGSSVTSCAGPSLTASVSNDTLLSISYWYTGGSQTLPSGMNSVMNSGGVLMAGDKYLTASGATGTTAWTGFVNGDGQVINLLLKPN